MTPEVVYDYNKDFVFNQHAPWTKMAMLANDATKFRKPVIVPPLKDWFFFRGDKVKLNLLYMSF
jgi:hypothetical protein